MASKESQARPDQKFYGDKTKFNVWWDRHQARVRSKGPNYRSAMRGEGVFTGLRYSPSVTTQATVAFNPTGNAEERSLIQKINKTKNESKPKLQEPTEDTKVVASPAQRLYNFYCEIVYDLTLKYIDDKVYMQLKNKKLAEGDGFMMLRLLKEIYIMGTNAQLVTSLRQLIRMKQGNQSLDKFTYDFTTLINFFKVKKAAVNDTLAVLIYIEALSPKYDQLRSKIIDETLVKVPTLEEVIRRIAHNTENSGAADEAFSVQTKSKPNLGEMRCYNCGSKHPGGERKCIKPCKICKSNNHTRYHCPKRKKGGNKGNRDSKRHNNNANAGNALPDWGLGTWSADQASVVTLLDGGAGWHFFNRNAFKCDNNGIPTHDNEGRPTRNYKPATGNLQTAGSALKYKGMIDTNGLQEVKLVNNIKANLVSVTKVIDDEACMLVHGPKRVYKIPQSTWMKIFKYFPASDVQQVATRKGHLYEYTGDKLSSANQANYMSTKPSNPLMTLHQRMGHRAIGPLLRGVQDGHIRCREIEKLSKNKINSLLEDLKNSPCVTCAKSRTTRVPARRSKKTTKSPGQVGIEWQTDLCYPVNPALPSGERGWP
jgi:hypothetical protein